MKSKLKATPKIQETLAPLPPQVPQTLPELERAIMLLGSRTKVGLGPKAQQELDQLLGASPSQKQAVIWKTALSRLRREHIDGTTKPPPGT